MPNDLSGNLTFYDSIKKDILGIIQECLLLIYFFVKNLFG